MPLFKPIQDTWINPYKVRNYTTLIATYNKLAKRANQRMRELEKKERKTGQNTTYGAYRKAQMALGAKEGEPPKRFKENMKWEDTTHELYKFERAFLQVQEFLGAKTGTLTGLREIKEKREQAWKNKGIRFDTDEDFYNFLNSDLFKTLAEQLDSDKVVEIFDQMREFQADEKITEQLQYVVDRYKERQKVLSEKILNKIAENAKGGRKFKKKGFKPRR